MSHGRFDQQQPRGQGRRGAAGGGFGGGAGGGFGGGSGGGYGNRGAGRSAGGFSGPMGGGVRLARVAAVTSTAIPRPAVGQWQSCGWRR
ncbi:hypothetical protein ADM96_04920 [Burkholderia sp. ST111]|nr:hypothetical protein ADM96_04920 [Burkholderia sp. ST111]